MADFVAIVSDQELRMCVECANCVVAEDQPYEICVGCVEKQKRTCDICGFVSSSRNAKSKHLKLCRLRSQQLDIKSSGQISCVKCSGSFQSPGDYQTHRQLCHRTCLSCLRVFRSPYYANRHEKTAHKIKSTANFRGSCEKCSITFDSRVKLVKHILKCVLNIEKKMQMMSFDSKADYKTWLEKLQLDTNTFYSKHSGEIQTETAKYRYLYCQHNQGTLNAANQIRQTSRKRKFGLVPDYDCPSKIAVCERNSKLYVKLFLEHNHVLSTENLKFQPLPSSIRQTVKMMVAVGVEQKKIYRDLTDDKWNRENRSQKLKIDKVDHLTQRYVNQVRSKQRRLSLLHDVDAIATHERVKILSKEEYNPILLYKPHGFDEVLIGSTSKITLKKQENFEELFCLGIQTKEQRDILLKYGGKIVCADATHGVTAYDFQLFTLIVKDHLGKGYPVAHLITSNTTKVVISSFLQEIKERNQALEISLTMTDDDAATKDAFREVFGESVKNLLCHWHIEQAWKRNLNKIAAQKDKDEIIPALVETLKERDVQKFRCICDFILTEYEHCKIFLQYLQVHYFNRAEEWAGCYRNFFHDGVETNMLLESFHNILKSVELVRLPNRRVDTLVDLLLTMDKERYKSYTINIANGVSALSNSSDILVRHKRGLLIPDKAVELTAPLQWLVQSSTTTATAPVVYNVWRKSESLCLDEHCYVNCSTSSCVGLCMHLYKCTCPDRDPMCKHIHKVHSMWLRNSYRHRQVFKKTQASNTTVMVSQHSTLPLSSAHNQPAFSSQPTTRHLIKQESEEESDNTTLLASSSYEKLMDLNQEISKYFTEEYLRKLHSYLLPEVCKLQKRLLQLLESGPEFTCGVDPCELKMLKALPMQPNARIDKQPTFKRKSSKTKTPRSAVVKVVVKSKLQKAFLTTSTKPASQGSHQIGLPGASKQPSQLVAQKSSAVVPVALQQTTLTAVLQAGKLRLTRPQQAGLQSQPARIIVLKPRHTSAMVVNASALNHVQNQCPPNTLVMYDGSKLEQHCVFFTPLSPTLPGEMYSNSLVGIDLSKSLFQVMRSDFSHYTLKSLETGHSIETSTILKNYCQSLTPPKSHNVGWLNDTVIDGYLAVLCSKFSNLILVNCSEVQLYCKVRTVATPRNKTRSLVGKNSAEFLLLPYNPGNVHWTLLIYDVRLRAFLYLDSMSGSVPDANELDMLKISLHTYFEVDSEESKLLTLPCAQQKDSYNCGIFLLHFAELCAQRLAFTTPLSNPKHFREKVFKTLVYYQTEP